MTRGLFVAGTDASASELNDCFDPPRCRAIWTGAAITPATGVQTAITLDTDLYDTGAMHDTAVNNSRLTCPAGGGGLYVMGGNIEFAANATGTRGLSIRLNGATTIAAVRCPPTAADATRMAVTTEWRLVAGDYVELVVVQSSGAGLAITNALYYSPTFWARWVAV